MSNAKNAIRFLAHKVTNGTDSARVHYCAGQNFIMVNGKLTTDTRLTVTVYAKDYGCNLFEIFGDAVQNDTDIITDYHETSRMRFIKGHPLFEAALARAKTNEAKEDARRAKRLAS